MSGAFPVAWLLFTGWGVWRRLGDRHDLAATLAGSTLAATAVALVWMALLDLVGLRWSPALLCAPLLPALVLAVTARRRRAPRAASSPWGPAAAALVAVRAAALLAVPAFGWDFRYIWGLKARVFAVAGAHDLSWLAWPGVASFAHPGYPPLWSDLVAYGVVLGAGAPSVAAAWSAALAAALAAACWSLAARAPAWARAVAAVAAAWSPALLDPEVVGYAEVLLAFLAAAGLGAVLRVARREPGAAVHLAVVAALLALTKNEGAALALGLVVAAVLARGPRAAAAPLLSLGAAWLAWQAALPVAAAGSDFAPSWSAAAAHTVALPRALVDAVGRTPVLAAVLAAWIVCLIAWRGRELRPVRVACGVWALAVLGAYLSTAAELTWHLATSADRVLAVPLPAALALAVSASFTPGAAAGGPPSPDR